MKIEVWMNASYTANKPEHRRATHILDYEAESIPVTGAAFDVFYGWSLFDIALSYHSANGTAGVELKFDEALWNHIQKLKALGHEEGKMKYEHGDIEEA